ncbi:Cell cycle checkpoint protein rad17 [Entomortierella beljakovae]|nr:Cell cycle checkpoint protein rad17 [Entomortierella beljakovae]
MYKDSAIYLVDSDDEISDQISEPEDSIIESDIDSDIQEGQDSDEQGNSAAKKKGGGRKKTPKATTTTKRNKNDIPNKTANVVENGKGRSQKSTSVRSKQTKASTSKLPIPLTPKPASTTPTGIKRKLSNIRFGPLSSSPASSSSTSSSTTPTSTSTSSQLRAAPKDTDQWAERHAPTNIDEVAVHPGKIGNVREWLQIYTDPLNKQQDLSGGAILILSGPAGSGKTTVLQMLAQEMNLNIVEWVNSVNENSIIQRANLPTDNNWKSSSIDEEYIPVMRAFQEFFSRAQRFSPLAITRDPSRPSQGTGNRRKRNIILIEDIPPISAYSSRKIFQDTISKFANSRSGSTSVLVIIVSDVFTKQSTELQFSNSNESRDPAMTIRTLLPSTILDRIDSGGKGFPRIKQIKFNPIAPTIMKKALRRLIDFEFRTKHAYAPETAELEYLIDTHDGDIRAVINSLQFMCHLTAKKRKKYREQAEKLEEEQELLHSSENKMILGQDSSLGIFHAVAKVLYNRRDWSTPPVEFDKDIVKIPLNCWSRRRPPLNFNPEKELIEKLPIEPDLFTLMLHQNYTRHLNTISECQTAIEYLCISDLFSGSSGSSSGYTQMIQMQPYMTSLAVRGLLYAPTSSGPPASSSGQKKHWWPELFSVNRTTRTNDQMFMEITSDLAGNEAPGLPSSHITGPGFIPKRAIREELVPILHKCVTMNPYMNTFKSLRPSSKNFVRNSVGNYGKRIGTVKKEFGEGDEGYLEEVVTSTPTEGTETGPKAVDEITDDLGSSMFNSRRQLNQPQQQLKRRFEPHVFQSSLEEDPIEDFSD